MLHFVSTSCDTSTPTRHVVPAQGIQHDEGRAGRLNNWCQRLKSNLSEHGFQHVCTSETIANENEFLRCLKQKLIDCFDHNLFERMTNNTRYALYRLIKPDRSMERYLQILDTQVIRDLVIRFRVGTREINAHRN